jgi:hypothetical protein
MGGFGASAAAPAFGASAPAFGAFGQAGAAAPAFGAGAKPAFGAFGASAAAAPFGVSAASFLFRAMHSNYLTNSMLERWFRFPELAACKLTAQSFAIVVGSVRVA